MKKKFFSCFKPLVLETVETEQTHVYPTNDTISQTIIIPKEQKIKVLKISGHRKKPERPFSQVLEILLHRASLVLEILLHSASLVCERNTHHLSLQPKSHALGKMCRRLQISDDVKTRTAKGIESNIQETEIIRSSSSSSSSYESKNTGSLTVGNSLSGTRAESFDQKETRTLPEKYILRKPCICTSSINPGLYLLVFTLFFTIVWGRVRALLFTLIFLYLFRGCSSRQPENEKMLLEKEASDSIRID